MARRSTGVALWQWWHQWDTRRLNCRAPCCVVPAMTPDGEDTPAWVARAALREEIEAGIAQPDFGAGPAHEKSPDKTIFTHDPASGMTPLSTAWCD